MFKQLTCDSLGELDGGNVRRMIDKELARAISDLEDRGADGKERTVVINVAMVLHKGKYVVEAKAKASLPAYRSGITVCDEKAAPGGECSLFFQADNPEAPDQPTFEFDGDNDKK